MKPVLLLFLMLSLCACANPIPRSASPSDGLHAKVVMNYDLASVEKAMGSKGIRYRAAASESDWILAGVEPAAYLVGSARGTAAPEEEASIYVFASEEERKAGLRHFRKQTEKYNMVYPRIYEKRNVLILYWSHEDMHATAALEEKFTNAMDSLRIVTEFQRSTIGGREIPYTIRIGGGRYGGIAFDKGAAIQSVDTHRSGRMHSVQLRGLRLPSAIEVEYRARNVLVQYTESSSPARENVLVVFRDDDLDPSRIQWSVNGRKQRIAGVEHSME